MKGKECDHSSIKLNTTLYTHTTMGIFFRQVFYLGVDLLRVTIYNVTRNREVIKIAPKSRADYMKQRREKTRNFSVELDREKFDKLEEKLSEKGMTKKEWLNNKVDEEIGR